METTTYSQSKVSASADLQHRLMKLKYRKEQQEEMIRHDIDKVKNALRPTTIVRNAFSSLKNNSEFRNSAIKQTVTAAAGMMVSGLLFKGVGGLKRKLLIGGAKKVFSYFMKKKKAW